MGDFDKKKDAAVGDAAAKQKKQLALVSVLGCVLLGVVGFHFMKGGPQTAAADMGGPAPDGAVAASEQTPAQALAALDPSRDPTKDLLLGTAALPESLTEVPRNPFKLSDKWRAQLLKAVKPAEAHVEPRMQPVTAPVTPNAQRAATDGLKVAGILRQDQKLYAIINGSLVTVGAVIGNARVVEIQDDRVLVRHMDWPAGPVSTLMIQGRKN